MKITIIAVLFALFGAAMAYPQYENEGGWKTWGALKDFFKPVTRWFSEELPHKSPSDLMGDAKDTAVDVKNWAQNNAVVQGVGEAVQPVQDWVLSGVDYVKDKPLRVIYGDVKDTVNDMDQTVGGWIDRNVG